MTGMGDVTVVGVAAGAGATTLLPAVCWAPKGVVKVPHSRAAVINDQSCFSNFIRSPCPYFPTASYAIRLVRAAGSLNLQLQACVTASPGWVRPGRNRVRL